jgi:hypothetical protein
MGDARLEFTKWGGQPHWRYPILRLGRDRFGDWFGAHAGVPLQRGHEPAIEWDCDFVILVPAEGEWVATFNASGKYPIYIDVTGPISIENEVIRAADLDLDVVRLPDGDVRMLDEDEFAEHQVRYGYPAEVIARAQSTADWLMIRVAERHEPFDAVGPSWLTRLGEFQRL